MNTNTPLQNARLAYERAAVRLTNLILAGYGPQYIFEAEHAARKAQALFVKLEREASVEVLRSTGGGVDGA